MSEARRQCNATAKSTGERCKRAPHPGSTVCIIHGAGSPKVRAAARRRLEAQRVEADARAVLAHQGLAAVGDPLEELGRLATELVQMKDAVSARVNSLESIRYSAPGSGSEQIRGEVQLLGQLQDRVTKVLTVLVSSGFAERRVRVSEVQGRMVGIALQRILERLELDERQRSVVNGIVVEELMRLKAVSGEVVR